MNYYETLRQLLSDAGLTEEQINLVQVKITEANSKTEEENKKQQELQEKSQLEEENKKQEKLLEIVALAITNIKPLTGMFKPGWGKYIYDLIIALSLVATVIILSLKGVLGACETSTILSGIVGYLLGKGRG